MSNDCRATSGDDCECLLNEECKKQDINGLRRTIGRQHKCKSTTRRCCCFFRCIALLLVITGLGFLVYREVLRLREEMKSPAITNVPTKQESPWTVSLQARYKSYGIRTEGRVEVNMHGVISTVCDDSWDDNDATVVCRMLGFGSGIAMHAAFYGRGKGTILIDDVNCTGFETNLQDCGRSSAEVSDCTHSEDAGVLCLGSTSTPRIPTTTTTRRQKWWWEFDESTTSQPSTTVSEPTTARSSLIKWWEDDVFKYDENDDDVAMIDTAANANDKDLLFDDKLGEYSDNVVETHDHLDASLNSVQKTGALGGEGRGGGGGNVKIMTINPTETVFPPKKEGLFGEYDIKMGAGIDDVDDASDSGSGNYIDLWNFK